MFPLRFVINNRASYSIELGSEAAVASIEPLASLIRLSIMSSLEQRRRRCRLLVRRLVQPNLDGVRGPPAAGVSPAPSAPFDSQD